MRHLYAVPRFVLDLMRWILGVQCVPCFTGVDDGRRPVWSCRGTLCKAKRAGKATSFADGFAAGIEEASAKGRKA